MLIALDGFRLLTDPTFDAPGHYHAGPVHLEKHAGPALSAEVEDLRLRYGYAVAPGRNAHLDRVEDLMESYFAGTLQEFSIPLTE